MQTLNVVVADSLGEKKMENKNIGDHINITDDRYCCNVFPKLLAILRRSRFYYDRQYRF